MDLKSTKFLFILFFLLFGIVIEPAFTATLESHLDSLVAEMTLQEKIDQLINNGFMTTPENERLDIPGFVMDDGPHGVRFETATCFPLTMSMAAMWDRDIWYQLGKGMGEEFQGFGKHVQLGPCIDLTRDPRNGRSGESGGEDPYLCGQLAIQVNQGIQTTPTIATTKHYNCVNRQDNRNSSDVIISERQLMGHYGYNFRKAIQEGGGMAIMSSYNLINGQHASENDLLLNGILKKRWGFPFMVMSDWGSIHNSEKAIKAGNDLCMGSDHFKNDLGYLVNNRSVDISTINSSVKNVFKTKMLSGMLDNAYPRADLSLANTQEHQKLCLQADRKGIVLLKNQDDILPLSQNKTIALIGPSANEAQINIFGSSKVTPPYSISPRQGIESKIGEELVSYTKGCDILSNDTSGFAEARTLAQQSDYVVFVGGLDETVEGEGYGDGGDRKNNSIQLPEKQQMLINELAKANQNMIVILQSGGICAIDNCIQNIKGLLYSFYTSQEGGNALADVLFGDYNPGGKLPVTMPVNDQLMPERNSDFTDDYNCGYRYYDETGHDFQYAFGYGLSYTNFTYSDLSIQPENPVVGDTIMVSFQIQNTGDSSGEEVAQLYVTNLESYLWQPEKELRDFRRIYLEPGESKTVTFTLDIEDLYYFDESTEKYDVESGKYAIKVGGSSDNLPLTDTMDLDQGTEKSDLRPVKIYTYPRYPEKGDSVLVLATIKNYGTKETENSIRVKWSHNGTDFAYSSTVSEPILPGEMRLISCDTEVKNSGFWQPQNEGKFPIKVIVDPEDNEDEYFEENNSVTQNISVQKPPPENLALECTVEASSVESDAPANVDPKNINDGDMSTRWSSEFSDPQYIILDMGEIKNFTRINIYWEDAYASAYSVQISNDSENWKTIQTVENGDGGLDQIDGQFSARYVKMYATSRATEWGYSIYEIEIYNMNDETHIYNLESHRQPQKFELQKIYPNPFNSITTIRYCINKPSFISLQIYNIIGEYVETLVEKKFKPGHYQTVWKGQSAMGKQVSSGIYLIRLSSKDQSSYQKIAYMK